MLYILIEIISRAHGGGGGESINGIKFGTVIGHFPSDGTASMAVKGLKGRKWNNRAVGFSLLVTLGALSSVTMVNWPRNKS